MLGLDVAQFEQQLVVLIIADDRRVEDVVAVVVVANFLAELFEALVEGRLGDVGGRG